MLTNVFFFPDSFKSYLLGHWYPCFGLLVTSAMVFKPGLIPHLHTSSFLCNGFCWSMDSLPPANVVCEGYVFTPVCQSFCSQMGACIVGGMCGRGHTRRGGMHGRGACVAGGCAWQRGMRGGGHAWQGGMHGGGHVWQILRDTVNERAARILLECILVNFYYQN